MRSFIFSIIIGILLVTGSIIYTNHMEKLSTELIECNDIIYSLIEEENYSEAEKMIESLSMYIENKTVILAATGNHEEIDKIEITIAQLRQFISQKSCADALAFSRALDVQLKHLPKNYRLRLENIL